MSDEEITSGARWNDVLADSLDETNFGILCITRKTKNAPWLIFEAGALAKSVKTAKLVPLCIDLLPSDLKGLLESFQGRSLTDAGMKRLVQDLNKATEKPLEKDRLNRVFDRAWPDLKASTDEALKGVAQPLEPQREPEDMLAELVGRVRRIERSTDLAVSAAILGDRASRQRSEVLANDLWDWLESQRGTRTTTEAARLFLTRLAMFKDWPPQPESEPRSEDDGRPTECSPGISVEQSVTRCCSRMKPQRV